MEITSSPYDAFKGKFERIDSTFETVNLIGSVPRNLQTPEPDAAMNSESQQLKKLDTIIRNQKAILRNQQWLEQKLDGILSLLSPTAQTLLKASPVGVVPVQPATSLTILFTVKTAVSSAVSSAASLLAPSDQPV